MPLRASDEHAAPQKRCPEPRPFRGDRGSGEVQVNGSVEPPRSPQALSADEVELRPTQADHTVMRFDICVAGQRAGWITLTRRQAGLRLTGQVLQSFEGRGIATAAVAIACRIVYSTLGMTVIDALVPGDLGAAQRVLEANGFTCADLLVEPLVFQIDMAAAPAGHNSRSHRT
jgi:hypothetical protein